MSKIKAKIMLGFVVLILLLLVVHERSSFKRDLERSFGVADSGFELHELSFLLSAAERGFDYEGSTFYGDREFSCTIRSLEKKGLASSKEGYTRPFFSDDQVRRSKKATERLSDRARFLIPALVSVGYWRETSIDPESEQELQRFEVMEKMGYVKMTGYGFRGRKVYVRTFKGRFYLSSLSCL